jgi:hypothetical protein
MKHHITYLDYHFGLLRLESALETMPSDWNKDILWPSRVILSLQTCEISYWSGFRWRRKDIIATKHNTAIYTLVQAVSILAWILYTWLGMCPKIICQPLGGVDHRFHVSMLRITSYIKRSEGGHKADDCEHVQHEEHQVIACNIQTTCQQNQFSYHNICSRFMRIRIIILFM